MKPVKYHGAATRPVATISEAVQPYGWLRVISMLSMERRVFVPFRGWRWQPVNSKGS